MKMSALRAAVQKGLAAVRVNTKLQRPFSSIVPEAAEAKGRDTSNLDMTLVKTSPDDAVSSPRLSDLKRGVWKEDADFSGHELLLPGGFEEALDTAEEPSDFQALHIKRVNCLDEDEHHILRSSSPMRLACSQPHQAGPSRWQADHGEPSPALGFCSNLCRSWRALGAAVLQRANLGLGPCIAPLECWEVCLWVSRCGCLQM
eukprot:s515_g6.t1